MELTRRQLLAATSTLPILAALPGNIAFAKVVPEVAPAAARLHINVRCLFEYDGGDFGQLMSVYTEGHVAPLEFVKRIDMDDIADIIGEEAFEDATDEDGDFIDTAAMHAQLASMAKHSYGVWRRPECECDGGCECCEEKSAFYPAKAGDPGAFPVTIIDID